VDVWVLLPWTTRAPLAPAPPGMTWQRWRRCVDGPRTGQPRRRRCSRCRWRTGCRPPGWWCRLSGCTCRSRQYCRGDEDAAGVGEAVGVRDDQVPLLTRTVPVCLEGKGDDGLAGAGFLGEGALVENRKSPSSRKSSGRRRCPGVDLGAGGEGEAPPSRWRSPGGRSRAAVVQAVVHAISAREAQRFRVTVACWSPGW